MTDQAAPEVQAASKPKLLRSATAVKHTLYLILAFFSFLLFIISCVVVPFERDQYGGYNPPAAALAFTGGVGAFFLPLFVWSQRVRPDFFTNTLIADLGFLAFMWFFLLGGVGALTAQTYDLLACQDLFICRGFSAMMAFSWISWIITTVMIGYICVIMGSLWSREQKIEWTKPLKEVMKAEKAKNVDKMAEKEATV
ncbi:uncharacterized protein MELLADRAFT_104766 [Melampsora larici-populina 98AG31]|uniref:MARVEL domain-containing protein n=1 Tax=Melampsora larici-populina (strain 98AG31 / pathotype 3-4-7) TaxID=747676 RepID=F4RFU3_MELLP|nr:uncharacterized protein MELLADRAFT_104766 [Melampsora larici-populina 98AG31]EGG08868.1 hypothetical protein MELLADRAFT_104766 [Melampsora larici-populina 98AG31]